MAQWTTQGIGLGILSNYCLGLVALQRRDGPKVAKIRSQVPRACDSDIFPLEVWLATCLCTLIGSGWVGDENRL